MFFVLELGPGCLEDVLPLKVFPTACFPEISCFAALSAIAGSAESDTIKHANAYKALSSSFQILEDRHHVSSAHFSELSAEL